MNLIVNVTKEEFRAFQRSKEFARDHEHDYLPTWMVKTLGKEAYVAARKGGTLVLRPDRKIPSPLRERVEEITDEELALLHYQEEAEEEQEEPTGTGEPHGFPPDSSTD